MASSLAAVVAGPARRGKPGLPRLLRGLVRAAAGLAAAGWAVAAMAGAGVASPAATDPAPLPALAAQFRVTLSRPGLAPRQQTWQLVRSADQISWQKGPGTEEIWRRDASGIRLARVMRADRHVIDYSAGELRALEVAVDWLALASLFPAARLALLKAMPSPQGQGQGKTQHWVGRIGAEQVDLLWDPVAQLPARLARSGPGGRVLFERTALQASIPAHWPQPGAGIDDFQRVDAADFGDMDYNPVVRKAQALDQRAGWRRGHAD